MHTKNPAISIGLPVFNGEPLIRASIESILSQDFDDFELIVVDNASTDRTPAICQEYAKRDSRVRLSRNATNIGAGPNHNLVFELSQGKYFKWAAHDVECLPGMLRRCYEVISRAPQTVALVYPRCHMVDATAQRDGFVTPSIATGDVHAHQRIATVMRELVWVNQLYGLMPVHLLRRTRLIDSFPASDYVLLMELAILGEIIEIPETLLRRTLDPRRGTAAHQEQPTAWAAWLDPGSEGKRVTMSHDQRLLVEYLRSARRLARTPAESLLCMSTVLYDHVRKTIARPMAFRLRRWTRRLLLRESPKQLARRL